MKTLQELKGTYFAIKVNNNLDEIEKKLVEEGFEPDAEWNLKTRGWKIGKINHVVVYEDLSFEFHTHDGNSKKILEL